MRTIIFLVVVFIAFGFFIINIKRLISYLKIGEKENRFTKFGERLKNVITIAIGQSKLFREPVAGLMHAFIFWGFLSLLIIVLESLIQGFDSGFNFAFFGVIYNIITFLQDIFCALVIISVFVALHRRFVQKLKRLKSEKNHELEAALILFMILTVIISIFGQNIFNPYHSSNEYRFVSQTLAGWLSLEPNNLLYEIFWWIHLLTILIFLNYLPYSKHLHILTSIPNVYFSKLSNEKGTIKQINLEDESLTHFGAIDVEHLTWKNIFDGYTCTECGRCTSACPANYTGKTLSPRKIIMDIRQRTLEKAPIILTKKQSELLEKTLVHNYITDEEIWACTTCNACVTECPVMIEHLDSIVEMRRGLVLNEATFPNELNVIFKNLEVNGSPWAFSPEERLDWAEGLNLKVASNSESAEYLFWVGCAGAFDARYRKVSRAMVKILQSAGIDFMVLGKEERCNGDAARRLGNEYLAQILIKENIQTLEKYGVKKIITTCPHCLHSLKNEYKQFGGNYEVFHHSELIQQFISTGKLKLNTTQSAKITYHDSCYLGRYNNIYEQPRKIINQIAGLNLVEMNRVKDKGFCCGAGGGRMWMEETQGKRINIERIEEALNLNPDFIASACPFCLTMLEDGIKTKEASEKVKVKDLAEIVADVLV